MIEIMRDYRHPTPEFVERGEFLVTFRNSPAASEAALPVSETLPAPEELPVAELTQEERQRRALEYVQKYGSIANKEYRTLTGVSESTAMRDLETLVEKGSLKMTGMKRTRRYSL
jgi:ATP-dependent DNA helicase RecG